MSTLQSQIDHPRLALALRSLEQAASDVGLAELQAELIPLHQRYRTGTFPLLTMGEIKTGKSTIVGAMLSAQGVVPTDVDIATSTVYKVHHGLVLGYRVHLLPAEEGAPEPAPLTIARAELEAYGTENGNPGNERRVDFIEVECPHPLLESGIVLVDLPGLGGIVHNHATQVMRHLPSAAGVVYVLSSTDVVSELDLMWIKRLRDRPAPPVIVFLQSKADIAGDAQAMERKRRNLEALSEVTGIAAEQLPYFVVSSVAKMAAESRGEASSAGAGGFAAFQSFVTGVLVRRKQELLALPVWKTAFDGVHARMRELEKALQIASTTDQKLLDEMDRHAKDSRERLETWKRDEKDDVFATFSDAIDAASREAEDRIAREIDPSPHGPVIGTRLEELREAPMSPGDIADGVDDEADTLVANCDRALARAIHDFDRASAEACVKAAEAIGSVLQPNAAIVQPDNAGAGSALRAWVPNSLLEVSRNTFYGGVFASGAAYAIVGVLFPPAAAVAAVAGALLGGFEMFRVARSRQRKAVLDSVRAMLSDLNRRLHDASQKTLRRHAADTKKAMVRQMEKAIRQREEALRKELQEIAEQRRAKVDDARQRQQSLGQQLSRLSVVARQLNEARMPGSANTSKAAAS